MTFAGGPTGPGVDPHPLQELGQRDRLPPGAAQLGDERLGEHVGNGAVGHARMLSRTGPAR